MEVLSRRRVWMGTDDEASAAAGAMSDRSADKTADLTPRSTTGISPVHAKDCITTANFCQCIFKTI